MCGSFISVDYPPPKGTAIPWGPARSRGALRGRGTGPGREMGSRGRPDKPWTRHLENFPLVPDLCRAPLGCVLPRAACGRAVCRVLEVAALPGVAASRRDNGRIGIVKFYGRTSPRCGNRGWAGRGGPEGVTGADLGDDELGRNLGF